MESLISFAVAFFATCVFCFLTPAFSTTYTWPKWTVSALAASVLDAAPARVFFGKPVARDFLAAFFAGPFLARALPTDAFLGEARFEVVFVTARRFLPAFFPAADFFTVICPGR